MIEYVLQLSFYAECLVYIQIFKIWTYCDMVIGILNVSLFCFVLFFPFVKETDCLLLQFEFLSNM